ncbi:hypothetical protein [Sphingomonas sp.]|uniref:hypothetical protein n=1 Tax=Sphingomonas sp. TaxID=28214 RepID=UPI003B3B2A6B
MRTGTVAALLAALLAGRNASAQVPSSAGDSIIVEGRRPAAGDRAQDWVRAISPYPSSYRALARFNMPVCFSVAGLPHDFAVEMANRMVDDAQAAHVPLAGNGCSPNVHIFVGDPASAGFQKARHMLDARDSKEGPALVRFITTERSRDGDQRREARMTGFFAGVASMKIPGSTGLGLAARNDIDRAVVVLPSDAVIGKTPRQLADYVVMRALARTNDYAGPGDTILSLFAGRPNLPEGLTAFDAAYLATLYRGPATTDAASKLGEITSEVRRHPSP